MDRAGIEKISKALADETRLKIFEAISASGHMNCGEIVSMRGVTPATVSHHLKILSEAGLISCRREGQFVYSEDVAQRIAAYTLAWAKWPKPKREERKSQRNKGRQTFRARRNRRCFANIASVCGLGTGCKAA